MKRCKSCGEPHRKGTRAFLVDRGRVTGGIVCSRCVAEHGVLIIAKPAAVLGDVGGKAEKRATKEVLAPFVKVMKSQIAALRAATNDDPTTEDFVQGKVEGIEGVLAMLEGART